MADDTGFIEPPPTEASAFVPPPSIPHHEDLTMARLAGYDWPDINDHLQEKTNQATAAGYSQREIDDHLGYPDPSSFQTRMERQWLSNTAADPEFATGLKGVPRSTLTPLDALSAGRMVSYAGLPSPQPDDFIEPGPAKPAPFSLLSDDTRSNYADALLNGEVKSPLDFAERYAGAFLNGTVDTVGNLDAFAPTVAHAARDLAGSLPSNEDLTDWAIGLAAAGDAPMTPGMIAVIKDNLAGVWSSTGQPLPEIYKAANTDPTLLDRLTSLKTDPVEMIAKMAALPLAVAEFWKGSGIGLTSPGEDIQQKAKDENIPLSEALGLAAGRVPGGMIEGIVETARRAGEALAGGKPLSPEEALNAAALGINGSVIRGRARVVDPMAPPGAAISEAPLRQAIPEASPINEVAQKLGANPSEDLAAKIAKIERLHTERIAAEAADTTGTFFQRLAKDMEVDAKGADHTPQEVLKLAEGYQTAGTLRATINDLLTDTSGAGLNIFTKAARDTDRTAWMSPAYREDREAAMALIREYRGTSDRYVAQTFARLEQYRREINKHLPEFEKEVKLGPMGNPDNTMIGNLYNYMEGRSLGTALKHDSLFAPVADEIRAINTDLADRINNSGHGQAFIEDYFTHMWKDPVKAKDVFLGVGRQGSGASLRERSIPTLSDGLRAGLEPTILDPIEAQLHYTAGMVRHLGSLDLIDAGHSAGYIKYFPMGKGDPGWEPLQGKAAIKPAGKSGFILQAYAPPGFSRAYNGAINTGWYGSPIGGFIYDKLRFATNSMTAAKLALSGYHAFNIVKEAAAAQLTASLGSLSHGDLLGGLGRLGLTPFAPITYAVKGRQIQRQFLGIKDYGPEMEKIVDALTGANMRMTGRQDIYRVGSAPTIFQSLRRGTLMKELGDDVKNVFGKPDEAIPFRMAAFAPRMAGMFMHEVGRVLDTAMVPLFDKYIPYIKDAAAADEMGIYLKANPTAGREDLLAHARKISDSMDDRFGEMNQDNLFWNQSLKQSINLAVVSLGWEYGSLRAFAGAFKDLATGNIRSTRARWLVSYPLMIGLMSAAYQFLKTGQTPSNAMDLYIPKTGGTVGGVPERTLAPGYEKDVMQWYKAIRFAKDPIDALQNFSGIGLNKLNPFWQTVRAGITGEDTMGHHIRNMPNPPLQQWAVPPGVANYMRFVAQQFVPIPIEQPHLKGSNISGVERFLGFRTAPKYMVDPEGYKAGLERLEQRRNKEELGRAKREDLQIENPAMEYTPAGPLPERQGRSSRQQSPWKAWGDSAQRGEGYNNQPRPQRQRPSQWKAWGDAARGAR